MVEIGLLQIQRPILIHFAYLIHHCVHSLPLLVNLIPLSKERMLRWSPPCILVEGMNEDLLGLSELRHVLVLEFDLLLVGLVFLVVLHLPYHVRLRWELQVHRMGHTLDLAVQLLSNLLMRLDNVDLHWLEPILDEVFHLILQFDLHDVFNVEVGILLEDLDVAPQGVESHLARPHVLLHALVDLID